LKTAKWNFPLMLICGNFSDITFYALWELQNPSFDSFASVFSFLMCLSVIILAFWVFFKAFFIVRKIRKDLQNTNNSKNTQIVKRLSKEFKDYKIFYAEYKNDTFLKLAFMPLLLLRTTIYQIIIATLYHSPLTQISFLIIMNILMLTYLFSQIPLKSNVEFFQLCLNEILLAVVNVGVLILGILDSKGISGKETREDIGEMIVKINIIFSAFSVAFAGIQMLATFWDFYTYFKKINKKKKKVMDLSLNSREISIQERSYLEKPTNVKVRRERFQQATSTDNLSLVINKPYQSKNLLLINRAKQNSSFLSDINDYTIPIDQPKKFPKIIINQDFVNTQAKNEEVRNFDFNQKTIELQGSQNDERNEKVVVPPENKRFLRFRKKRYILSKQGFKFVNSILPGDN